MPSSVYSNTSFRKAFDGYVLQTLDDGLGTSVYEFPADTFEYDPDTGTGFPSLIDNSARLVNKVAGVNTAPFQQGGSLRIDRGFAAFATQAVGPRTGDKLTDFILTISDYNGATPYAVGNALISRMQLAGAFGLRGQDAMIRYALEGMALDPLNAKGATVSSVPTGSGASGAGISTFANASFSNGAASSPTVYDGVRSFNLVLDNGITVDPSMGDVANRLAAGQTPGILTGTLTLTQLKGATNPLPMTAGDYPLNVILPSGDGAHTLTVALSTAYVRRAARYRPMDYNSITVSFQIYSGNATNGTSAYPVIFSYV